MMDSRNLPATATPPQDAPQRKKRISMHEGIAVWCDCCSCAAEPYWLAVAEEMGIDLGSDYED
jgi:nitroreductase